MPIHKCLGDLQQRQLKSLASVERTAFKLFPMSGNSLFICVIYFMTEVESMKRSGGFDEIFFVVLIGKSKL